MRPASLTAAAQATVAAALVVLAGCSARPAQSMAEGAGGRVNAPPRTVAVIVSRIDESCDDDEVVCAEVDAIRALLFTGVPGSGVPRALIRNEQEARQRHAEYLDALLEEGGHSRYVVRASRAEGRNDASPSWTVIVNHDALRIALEQQGVIRRFGY
ncbi:MAG: hypothetical protein ACREKM_06510 [Longimicrobiales bacterium]